jgi:indolepyruvate ferredoxin oxidoreductase, beta subunit
MAAAAEQAGSVVSSVLFGALCASGALPFGRASFEAVISEAGIGVQGSLRGFSLGFDGGAAPVVRPVEEGMRSVGFPGYHALLARAAALPEAAHEMLAEGLRHVVSYQDIAYGTLYLDLIESLPAGLTEVAAKYIARAMVYDDVIRVACLKTAPARAGRIQREMDGSIVATTEFMHPRMTELLGLLPPRLGIRLEQRLGLVAWMDRVFCGPRRVRSDRIGGFLLLYLVAGLRGWRRRSLRHEREWRRIEAWLASVRAAPDLGLAAELLANQRLIKGYSDTHVRGMDKFSRVCAAAERLAGRQDAAVWVRRLREAALKDERGIALDEALRTVDSFLLERIPA